VLAYNPLLKSPLNSQYAEIRIQIIAMIPQNVENVLVINLYIKMTFCQTLSTQRMMGFHLLGP
jgi:hypothetical protein